MALAIEALIGSKFFGAGLVHGVSDVNVFGDALRQLQIQVKPQALARYGLSF